LLSDGDANVNLISLPLKAVVNALKDSILRNLSRYFTRKKKSLKNDNR
jgi:hypothetical protein